MIWSTSDLHSNIVLPKKKSNSYFWGLIATTFMIVMVLCSFTFSRNMLPGHPPEFIISDSSLYFPKTKHLKSNHIVVYSIKGTNLFHDIKICSTGGFEVARSLDSVFREEIIISAPGRHLEESLIYVRHKPGLNNYSGYVYNTYETEILKLVEKVKVDATGLRNVKQKEKHLLKHHFAQHGLVK